MTKKVIFSLFLICSVLLVGIRGLRAQDNQGHIYVLTTLKLNDGPDVNIAKRDSMLHQQLMADKANKYILSTQLLRHYYGSDSRDLIVVREYKSFGDIEKGDDENQKYFEKVYPKKANLDAAQKNYRRQVLWHSDEILMDVPASELLNQED